MSVDQWRIPIAAVMSVSLLAGLGVGGSSLAATSDTVADTSVAATPDTVAETTSASPPLTGQILFTRAGGEFGDETVFMVNADGTDERRLTEPGAACCPALSPDGSQLMLMTEDQEPGEPLSGVIMSMDDGVTERIPHTDPALNLVPQAWSPDSERIAFEGWDDTDPTRTGVYTARAADGGDLTRLTSVDGPHDIPSDWSPDGTRIVYFRSAPDPNWDVGGSLWIVNSDGTEARPINTTGTVPSWWARWSPDGTKILFASARTHDEGAIWTVDADGSNLTQVWVDPDGGYPITPTWSPDGTMIVFALDPISDEFAHPPNEVYVISADGTDPALVLDGSDFKRRFEWWP